MGGLGRFAPASLIVVAMAATFIAMDGPAPTSSAPAGGPVATAEPTANRTAQTHAHSHSDEAPAEAPGAAPQAHAQDHADAGHPGTQLTSAEVDRYIGGQVRPLTGEQAGLYAVRLPDGE